MYIYKSARDPRQENECERKKKPHVISVQPIYSNNQEFAFPSFSIRGLDCILLLNLGKNDLCFFGYYTNEKQMRCMLA